MSKQSSIVRLPHSAGNLWDVISDVDQPEKWVPFLDSRTFIGETKQPGIYFPNYSSKFCSEPIHWNVLQCKPKQRELEFLLRSGPLEIAICVKIHDLMRSSLLEISASTEFSASIPSEINKILQGMVRGLSINIELIAKALYPYNNKDNAIESALPLLAERHPEMAIVPIKRVSFTDNFSNMMREKFPVIIRDYGEHLENFNSLSSFDWWIKEFGEQTVPFMEFSSMAYEGDLKNGATTLGNLISMIQTNPNHHKFALYEYRAAYILGLYAQLTPPSLIPKDCPILNSNIWIGTKNLRSPMHQDGNITDRTGKDPEKKHNLNFQLTGKKQVLLSHPNQTKYLYPAPMMLNSFFPRSEIDVFGHVNMEQYPEFTKAHLFETVLNPGELLYIPRGWWHAFYSLTNSINYNVFFSSAFL